MFCCSREEEKEVIGMSEAFCLWHDRKFGELAEWQQEQCEKEGMQCEDCQFLTVNEKCGVCVVPAKVDVQ